MFGISITDVVVVAVYSAVMIAIGLAAMVRIKNQEDYFLGGRRFGKVLQMFAAFSQAAGADTAVGTVTMTYRDGAGGICSHLNLLWATPIYWLTAPWYRRMRLLTLGDFFRERYQSRAMAMFYSVLATFFLVVVIGIGLKGVSLAVMGITLKPPSALTAVEQVETAQALKLETLSRQYAQGALNPAELDQMQTLLLEHPRHEFSYLTQSELAWFLVAIVFLYASTGGLKAAVWTNTVHGVLILILSFILIPFAVAKLNLLHGTGGWLAAGTIMHQELPGRFFSMFGSGENTDFTWYFILALSVMTTLNVAAQPNQLTANASARDELTARVGFMAGNFIKRFCTVLWGATGLLAFALYSRTLQNPDLAWGHATRDLLGGMGFGLVGLMIACLLSAFHSTAATLMISAASLFTRNVYEPLFPGRTESHYMLVGRLAGAGILAAAAWSCVAFDTLLEMLKFFWEYNVIVAATFWCGLKWRRATRTGAWASMVTAFVMFLLLPAGLPILFPSIRTDAKCLAMTRERIFAQHYAATQRDVEERRREIEHWHGPGAPPPPLAVGQSVSRPFAVAPRAIYWAEGISRVNGVERGEGLFYPEMFSLGQVFDFTRNTNALNETIRYTCKAILPFLVLIVVSLLTQPDDSEAVRHFFLRMRTKVRGDRAADEAAVQAAYANPASTRAVLIFPGSQFEFFKWNQEDTIGFTVGCLMTFAVLGLLYLILEFGA